MPIKMADRKSVLAVDKMKNSMKENIELEKPFTVQKLKELIQKNI